MALSFKKDLDKYKDIDEDEILNKLSEEELKQLETVLEEVDPEVRARRGLEELHGSSVGTGEVSVVEIWLKCQIKTF